MKITIQSNKRILLYLCETLAFLDNIDDEYASPSHKSMALAIRVNLGGRLFKNAMKIPVPEKMTINEPEARVLDFAIQHYPFATQEEKSDSRLILNAIQPKMI